MSADATQLAPNRPRIVAFVMQHLDAGGLERVVLNLLLHLDRRRFVPALILFERRGSLLADVPGDVIVRDLDGRAARKLPLRLAGIFSELAVDVVYAGTNATVLACLAATVLRRGHPPVIIGEHTPIGPFLRDAKLPGLRLRLMRWLYPRAAAVAVPVAELGDELRRVLRRPALPVIAVANPVVEMRPALEAVPPMPESPWFLAAGRLSPEKGFDTLIDAFARLCRRIPAARLTICGEGPERPRLEAMSQALGLDERLQLPGFVPDPIGRLGGGRIFVMSSRREGFPNVLIEALAAGMPVISADCPIGPRLVLQQGHYGLLVPRDNAEALADGMYRLLQDPRLAAEYRRRGPERTAAFEVRTAVAAFAELFDGIAQGRKPPALAVP